MTVYQFYFLFIGLYGLYVVWTYFTGFFMACQQKNSEGGAAWGGELLAAA